MEPDFSGWASKANLKCSDGRTIMVDAFKHQDKMTVPLVWQHQHNDPTMVLGHAVLESRAFGTYTYGFFNETDIGQHAKAMVKHKDVGSLSIYANKLVQRGSDVMHGDIKEVSLVLAGANPGAFIENINLSHGASPDEDGEAIIFTGLALEHDNMKEDEVLKTAEELAAEALAHAADPKTSVQSVIDSMNDDQKNVLYALVGEAAEGTGAASHSEDDEEFLAHVDERIETTMTNLFEEQAKQGITAPGGRRTLSHDAMQEIFDDAKKPGMTLKSAVLAHAKSGTELSHADGDYGIGDIDLLFPDAKAVQSNPDWVSRRMEYVEAVISGTRHLPFSRIKSLSADITADEARAKGYIKGNMKKEEFFAISRRITTPTTIYKKQKLDRDDILDVADFDVVAWLKQEMRMMLDEEIARAILVGDGREVDDDDKVREPANNVDGAGIRSIAYDAAFYAIPVTIPANTVGQDLVDAVVRGSIGYKGSGNPTMFTTREILTDLLLAKDRYQRRLYDTPAALAGALGVSNIVAADVLEDNEDLFAIIVNLADYSVGTDQGGEVNFFDFFDIDFNQNKYLYETRLSGALTKPASAVVIKFAGGTVLGAPTVPTFVNSTGVVTIPTMAHVSYHNEETGDLLTEGAQAPIGVGNSLSILAVADSGYYFPHLTDTDTTFTRTA